ncbi:MULTISPECIES: hypothetical protein [Burkholderia]|uniref:hypothetical protein n=1 Tax=Burkholderia TaxID=32008 RepID=UPI00103FDA9C|nr:MULTISPECIES: hypothetical protein [Burkholderia]
MEELSAVTTFVLRAGKSSGCAIDEPSMRPRHRRLQQAFLLHAGDKASHGPAAALMEEWKPVAAAVKSGRFVDRDSRSGGQLRPGRLRPVCSPACSRLTRALESLTIRALMVMWNHQNAASPTYCTHNAGLPGLQFEDQKLWCMPMLT